MLPVNAQGRRKRPQGQRTTPAPVPVESSVGVSDECPEPNGFFADAYQCDKYYQCIDGKVKEKLCPGKTSEINLGKTQALNVPVLCCPLIDGLVFLDAGPKIEKCEFQFAVDCTDRPELRNLNF